jgi:regulator of chromosome condensation
MFIFGTGDMGALGLGTEELGEINRPRLHKWFEAGIKEGRFGGEGKGIEEAVAGGMHTLVIDEAGKVWSWGVNDNASLGRITANVQDPEEAEGTFIDTEILETEPMLVSGLQEEEFRAVKAAAGDSISVVVGEEGDVRAWGSFRVSLDFDQRG